MRASAVSPTSATTDRVAEGPRRCLLAGEHDALSSVEGLIGTSYIPISVQGIRAADWTVGD
jgi:hypothetical protein